MPVEPFKPIGEVARWVPVYENLRDLEPGEVVTYAQLSELAGIDIRQDRSPFVRACTELLNKHGRTLINVQEVGYRVLRASEHGDVAKYQTKKASRRMRAAIALLEKADRNHLTPQQGAAYDARAQALQAAQDMTNRLAQHRADFRKDLLEAREESQRAREEAKALRRETKETTAELAERVDKQGQTLARLQQILMDRTDSPTT